LTEATVLQGAWLLLLSRYARERDVVTGLTVSGRPAELPGVFDGVGLFINTLPLRARVTDEPAVEWLQALQRRQLETQAHHWAPLASMQKWADLDPGDALFEHLLVIENHPADETAEDASGGPRSQALDFQDLDFRERSHFPFALLAVPGERLELQAVYDGSRYGRVAVARLLRQLSTLLRGITAEPRRSVDRLELDGPEEHRRRLVDVNSTERPYPRDATVHALIADAARRDPSAAAVLTDDGALTYGELLERARPLADALRRRGARPSQPVALLIERSADMVVGLVAILEAGSAYVPLDPAYPATHVRRVLADSGASAAVSRRRYAALLDGVDALWIDEPSTWPSDADAASGDPPAAGADDLAYIIYTSGSSGLPKGVAVSHRNLAASTWARRSTYGDGRPERFLLLSSFAFDSSVAGLFWTLTGGGALVLPRPGDEQDLDALDRLAGHHGVTHTLCLPSLYRLLLDRPATEGLRVAVVAGEACPPELAAAHFRRRPKARLFNEYGPTEATVWASVHELRPGDAAGPVPIGGPIANARLYVLDAGRRPVAAGVPGELYIAGDGVARYWRDGAAASSGADDAFTVLELPGQPGVPARTERAYRTGDLAAWDDRDRLLFLGRVDDQVKIRGHRLEIDGVEAALRTLASIGDAAAAARPGPRGARLCAWVVASDGARPGPREVRRALAEVVPDFMVPDVVEVVDALPRRPNGKVDYRALPDPSRPAPAEDPAEGGAAPRGEVEEAIARAWTDVLGVESIRRNHHFFELGGDSILGIQVVSRLRQEGLAAAPKDIAALPVLADLADALGRRAADADAAPAPAAAGPHVGELPLTPIQRWFFGRDLPEPRHWNLPALYDLDPALDLDALVPALESALGALLDRHDALRARFGPADGGRRQIIEAPGALRWPLEIAAVGTDDEARGVFARVHAG
ncbi:MAG: amino acid adenylation domain-containing protein, partial [Acidobacteriota bacterium]